MMAADAAMLPGVRFEVQSPQDAVQTLRTDIAGFVGPTLRGPVGALVRVAGWRAYLEIFGELTSDSDTAFALRGYFENGGEIAYVMRLAGPDPVAASALWTIGALDPQGYWLASAPAGGRFEAVQFRILAATPGPWANDLRVTCRYRLRGLNRRAEVDIEVQPQRCAGEYLIGLSAGNLIEEVAARSRLIRLEIVQPAPVPDPAAPIGPQAMLWPKMLLKGGQETAPDEASYAAGIERLADEREVALMAAPDLDAMPGTDEARLRIMALMIALAEARHDRQAIGSPPRRMTDSAAIVDWLNTLRGGLDDAFQRSLALYHPHIVVIDPLGGIADPVRRIAPAGHVAGVISRLDRERGAHHTPANAELYQTVDIAPRYNPEEQAALAMAGINPLLCATGEGIVIWGGRTAQSPKLGSGGLFLAHRRLIHRLVRAIRRVAEPLVFETNGPDLWLILARAITSLLVDAWQAGALKGETPEEAFLVRCDAINNPPELEDSGQVVCEIQLAPAIPMEFITLRIAMTREGRLEATET